MKGDGTIMATNKKTTKTVVPKAPDKVVSKRGLHKKSITIDSSKFTHLSGEQLVVENLSTLSCLVGTLSETLDVLVQKVENIAYHLIATEEVLAEVVTSTGIDLASVNARIRAKIARGTDKQGDPSRSIDIAASIVSPLPQTRK